MIDAAQIMADKLDKNGGWDWAEDVDTVPCDRFAVVRVRRLGASTIAGLVYRGTEVDSLELYPTIAAANKALEERVGEP